MIKEEFLYQALRSDDKDVFIKISPLNADIIININDAKIMLFVILLRPIPIVKLSKLTEKANKIACQNDKENAFSLLLNKSITISIAININR